MLVAPYIFKFSSLNVMYCNFRISMKFFLSLQSIQTSSSFVICKTISSLPSSKFLVIPFSFLIQISRLRFLFSLKSYIELLVTIKIRFCFCGLMIFHVLLYFVTITAVILMSPTLNYSLTCGSLENARRSSSTVCYFSII